MQTATMWFLAGIVAFVPARVTAQTPAPTTSTEVMDAAVQEAFKKALQDLKPGVSVSDRIVGLEDIGKYNVAVGVVAVIVVLSSQAAQSAASSRTAGNLRNMIAS